MKLFPHNGPSIKFFAAFVLLTLSVQACRAFIPSPVQTLTPPSTTVSPLPTSGASNSSTDGEPTAAAQEIATGLGEDFPIASAQHIAEGETATDWNSDPPTSGQHYGQWAPAGFYDDAIPDGYLVHNMEHGYVIIYYNCARVDTDCETFKTGIEAAMAGVGNDPTTNTIKLVAVPRPTMDNPITYASWGHLYSANTFIPEELVLYVQTYRSNQNYAPEWSLP